MKKKCKKEKTYYSFRFRNPFIKPDTLYQLSKLLLDFKKYSIKLYIDYTFPVNENIYKNEKNLYKNEPNINKKYMNYQYIKINKNYFDFDNIISFIKNIKEKKLDFIYINFKGGFIKSNVLTDYSNEELSMIIYINMLFFILSTQEKGGILHYSLPTISNESQIQIIELLNNYYEKTYITYQENKGYQHEDNSSIYCIGFRGIEKEELNEFYESYRKSYVLHVKDKVKEWCRQFKNENENIVKNRINKTSFLYLNTIFSNKIDKKIINEVENYYSIYFQEIYQNVLDKIKLDDIIKKSSITVKKYIFLTLFKEQYYRLIEHKANKKKEIFDFLEKCK